MVEVNTEILKLLFRLLDAVKGWYKKSSKVVKVLFPKGADVVCKKVAALQRTY